MQQPVKLQIAEVDQIISAPAINAAIHAAANAVLAQ